VFHVFFSSLGFLSYWCSFLSMFHVFFSSLGFLSYWSRFLSVFHVFFSSLRFLSYFLVSFVLSHMLGSRCWSSGSCSSSWRRSCSSFSSESDRRQTHCSGYNQS